jgi:small conductance mechanosensitive channel
MNAMENFLSRFISWLVTNTFNILYSIIVIFIVYALYAFTSRRVTKLRDEGRLDETVSFVLKRVFRWGAMLIVIVFIVAQFGIRLDLVTGLLVVAGGTVIGFASMNTLGNAIAGLILMTSRPFKIGDRLLMNGQFMDVESIDLIYTRMKTTDNIQVSIPNQKLLQTDLMNYGKNTMIRRQHSITAGYSEPAKKIENLLLESASRVEKILQEPEPFVWITDLQNFAVEYTLFLFIEDAKNIQEIDSKTKRIILETFEQQGVDLSTPNLVRSIK